MRLLCTCKLKTHSLVSFQTHLTVHFRHPFVHFRHHSFISGTQLFIVGIHYFISSTHLFHFKYPGTRKNAAKLHHAGLAPGNSWHPTSICIRQAVFAVSRSLHQANLHQVDVCIKQYLSN